MKKKLIITILTFSILGIIVFSIDYFTKNDTKEGSKEIRIKVVDEINDKVLYDDIIFTDALTLDKALLEVKELKVVVKEGPYGLELSSILEIDQTFDTGPWWVYSSDNNKTCLEQTFCPVLNDLPINDKDSFKFSYIDKFE